MITRKPDKRALCSSVVLTLFAGLSAVPSLASATPPGKAPWRYGSGFDPVRTSNTELQSQIDRDRQQELCARDVQSGRAQPGSCPVATPRGDDVRTTTVATSSSRQHQHVLPRATVPPNARGGGPRCDGADRSTNGHCVAPDLTPVAPQNDWDRDPRQPPMIQQNAPGPTAVPGENPGPSSSTRPDLNGTETELR